MKKLSSAEVRQMYIDFFASKGHKIEPSASLVPVEDPTLLWINSGVATLKKYFDGTIIPENPRIVNAQKSIRTNDIENVGKTARHHTLFEMLGNFSIGDYFKEDAITWAWELLTSPEWFDMEPEKLYMTVNPNDEKAKEIWLSLGIPEDHIIPLEENFWDIGAGPSGPNTEIFYDRGPEYNDVAEDDPENFPGGENERYLEIWNVVFSEFNHNPDDTFTPLPKKNIDTGMGLERMVSIIQDAPTNFETDLFLPIIKAVEKLSGTVKYGTNQTTDISFKVIADHVRAVSFAIGDGALPSNEGRGYVLRRLLRRAVMHGKKLGIHKAFMYQLVPVVGEIMNSYYPEILEQKEFIEKVIRTEEERFHETINDGLTILNNLVKELKEAGKEEINGKDIFKLYDTYGFPVELTEEYAEDEGLKVDHAGFEAEMEMQRNRARSARSDEKSMNVQTGLLADVKINSEFIGYDKTDAFGTLELIVAEDALVDSVKTGSEAQLLFNQTPFYAEMGGQVADTGVIKNKDGETVAKVTSVKKAPSGQPLHFVDVLAELRLGEEYELVVDQVARRKITRNHTATHLLHRALKDILGDHANQAGSLVAPHYLRFDFTHFGQITAKELVEMERIVNEKIWASLPVVTVETGINEAKEMGAMALFGEKYGEMVRVVNVDGYSIELCGGVHVSNTSEIGIFKILSESGIGAGVRRIEAVTSEEAYLALFEEQTRLNEVAGLVKAPQTKEVPTKVSQLLMELKEVQKENESLQAKLANEQAGEVFKEIQDISGVSVVTAQVEVKDINGLRQLADQWKQNNISDVLVLGSVQDGKVSLLAAVSEETIKKGLKAGDLIKEIAPLVGGGGGGRPDMAQAGGKNPAGLADALASVNQWVEAKI
ncbi:alanine--tRNA ligase [Carnobacterium maltaromaticum]|uniref:alanine--tRNA ligase n=1 Tax=Carnobacterium maltaromaticum TaxID=2751 RepID=UPI000C777DE1|nr:alanine--tRNA ligase [Carnobacterium maltaromaticum]PLS38299.1 alanine--tRNA ligase [Carnobacterium maltaromaticum]PLS38676.1 alanine--tRNA ligase [Carnobacterium maltaromaticum]PLS39053.1 alanine--tRNA ligase [Carnobacterium maltaromaticum]PLS45323.1 alanine--tRNA ligase [Carnobacterium maltaromaticum]PLS48178.1 alanine--tRNA ligase [Carnobacterium maltaromaticum]